MPTDVCIVCGQSGDTRKLGVWFVEKARVLIHVDCWIAESEARKRTEPDQRTP
jgi:hypothetical protein